jgi:hypothetical protein
MSVLFAILALIADPPPLRRGGDAEGGAPFVEADPRDPSKVRGFDVEVAEEIAKGLGRRSEFVQVALTDRRLSRPALPRARITEGANLRKGRRRGRRASVRRRVGCSGQALRGY